MRREEGHGAGGGRRRAPAGTGPASEGAGTGKKPGRSARKTEDRRAAKDEREAVLLALLSYEKNQTFSNVLVKRTLDGCAQLGDAQRAFVKRLLEGVIERKPELDAVIARYTGRPASRLHPVVHQILRMGLYQILYMDAVPDSAACNEAVRLAKKHGPAGLSGLVNGVLRNAARGAAPRQALPDPGLWPEWLVSMWTKELGEEQAKSLLDELMEIRPVSIRLCGPPSEEERAQLLHSLKEAGVLVEDGRWLPDHYLLRKTSNLTKLPGFAEGRWTVQDESSMLAVEAAGLSNGAVVYDVCAAPGGKTFFAAQKIRSAKEEAGTVRSFDLTPQKTARIREGARRLHLTNIEVGERDALKEIPAEERGAADVLLCDLPCSGLGVIGKKRDIKYRASLEGIAGLQSLQRRILRNAAGYLKKGGVLIYSTCTISRSENEENAKWIEEELGLLPDPLSPYLPKSIPGIRGNMIQLLPQIHGTDGFFIARFIKP